MSIDKRAALARLMPFQMAFLGSACLYVVAKLEIADKLRDGTRSAAELAAATGSNEDMLYRILRYLASEGIFEERAGHTFANNNTSALLRTDIEQSYQPFTILNCERAFEAVNELLPGVQSGEIPYVRRFGEHPFAAMHRDPERAKLAERGWQGVHGPETVAFLEAYDFTGIHRLADIGGGHGDVMVGFLEGDATRSGVIFDIPQVAGQVSDRLAAAGLAERCEAVGGNFFESIPVTADAFFLRHILHDWNDEECRTILRNIAASCRPGDRVLIAECVVGEPNVADAGKLLDMMMMVFLSGKERTEAEYRALLESTGFEYHGLTPTDSIIAVVEGRFTGP
jgi:hypothetical protein